MKKNVRYKQKAHNQIRQHIIKENKYFNIKMQERINKKAREMKRTANLLFK